MKANKFVCENLNDSSDILDIKRSISHHDGVNAVRVDMQAGTVTVDYDEARYSEGDVKKLVSQAGLQVKEVK